MLQTALNYLALYGAGSMVIFPIMFRDRVERWPNEIDPDCTTAAKLEYVASSLFGVFVGWWLWITFRVVPPK